MSRPKNQHWVPRFYLRYFATPETYSTDEPQVWIFSKDEKDGDESITNIKNICAKRFLYSPKDHTGQRNWDLETKLEGVESLLSEIWGQLSDDFVDLSNPAIRKALSLFIAVMHLRNPSSLLEVKNTHKQLVGLYNQMPKHPDGTPDIKSIEMNGELFDVDVSGWHEYQAWGANDYQRFFVDQVEYQATFLAEILMKKRWSIVLTESNQFITTDNPLFIQHQKKKRFGFGTEGTLITFPLSQRRLLVMDDRQNEPANQYYPLKPGALGAFNYGIWRNARRFMISGRPIPEILSEIVSWSDAFEAKNE
ncbi:MAG: DUF4238 domain-containing protein [Desulfobacterium sp.]|nr:DUF4238 domain-containing protein [Desulfobacterium sp.]